MADAGEWFNLDQVCSVFDVDQRWVRQQIKRHEFPPPRRIDAEDCWSAIEVWSWLAGTRPDLAAVVPLEHWSRSGRVEYLGTREIHGGVVQDWRVETVPLRIVWKVLPLRNLSFEEAASLWPVVSRVVEVNGQIGASGPVLFVRDAQELQVDEWRWADLAQVLGGRAPYWSLKLRVPGVMRRWRPGMPAELVAAVPEIDAGTILRLAAALPSGTPAHQVLVELVQHVQEQATSDARADIDAIIEDNRAKWVQIAAEPMPVPPPPLLDDPVRRAGWLEILSRTDSLAKTTIRELVAYDGGAALPYSSSRIIDPEQDAAAIEWAARLQPPQRLTAAFELVLDSDQEKVEQFLVDPETDAPAVRLTNQKIRAVSPWRLPATSPLSEMILSRQVWVRVADGTLYPAPQISGFGLSFGYDGAGPRTLAVLIDRLLDDINAPAADAYYGAPAGLEELTISTQTSGAVLSRAELERARGRWLG
ncbi:hypothetical protein [Nocardia asiatica]|uniref:hypothetical protein n=1 Tax=Nocardia asiatica TaxID=209252 RepID=UPI0012FAE6D5|nr:hypothetical protein [Nocardia asiatica]